MRAMEPNVENIYAPAGGEPVIVRVKEGRFQWVSTIFIRHLRLSATRPGA